MKKIIRAMQDSQYEIIVGLANTTGVALGSFISYSHGVIPTIIGAALGGVAFRSFIILTANLLRPRYTISYQKIKSIFILKWKKDIMNFHDSNTSINEANFRMINDSQKILAAIRGENIFKNELTEVKKTISWLEKGSKSKNSFVHLMSREDTGKYINNLVDKVVRLMNVNELKINTSIVEPGCVALIEKMKEVGIPIVHQYNDIEAV